jgi:CheY-like chemotaxis protein
VARILLAEDNHDLRSALVRQLRRVGHEVIEASDGSRCLDLLRSTRVDLFIIDIFMPRIDGIAIIAITRRDLAQVPILAISGGGAVARDKTLEVARRFGATRTLTKPFMPGEFITAVHDLLATDIER